jgi:hypothetical protein
VARRAADTSRTRHRIACRACGSLDVRVVSSSREEIESAAVEEVRYYRRRWCRCNACEATFTGLWLVNEKEIERNEIIHQQTPV